eukprot:SAG31_NODE_28356_length_411_cov_0.961538_1_plen_87_part_01
MPFKVPCALRRACPREEMLGAKAVAEDWAITGESGRGDAEDITLGDGDMSLSSSASKSQRRCPASARPLRGSALSTSANSAAAAANS